ncbi:MAG TPA: LuxR C-terminal-related transcriptional regulator, partial [Nocardioides sp.]|nr:LuxR C-terminal-related transcriptional regulator [Nocardioides sp.]
VVVRWPPVDDARAGSAPNPFRVRRTRRSAGPPPDVAILVSDLSKISQVRGAQMLIGVLDVPWLVLAGVPEGPAWGALYERGASLVVSSDTGLNALCGLVGDLAGGRTHSTEGGRRELIHSWRNFAQYRGELTARVDSLTGREEEVLQQLYEGLAVRAIAERGEVTEATVRSQVKAILRKLEVNSQIAAVAAYQEVRANNAHRTAVLAGREPVDA